MNTPITNKTVDEWIVYHEPARIMRKLELDRAALMDALERLLNQSDEYRAPSNSAVLAARAALSAARANFPD